MTQSLIALIVDKKPELAQELVKSLNQSFTFTETDFTNSVHRAVQSHIDQEYTICFISDEFPHEELTSFFTDMLRLERSSSCMFILVTGKEPDEKAREYAKEVGFQGLITRRGSNQDKDIIREALKNSSHHVEVKKRTVDVKGAIRLILRELDRVARERKRGVDRHLTAIPMSLVELHSEFDPIIIKRYFDELDSQASKYLPFKVDRVDIPERILRKQLPGLAKDKYSGASHRVWEMLLDKHGVRIGKSAPKAPESNPGEDTPEQNDEPSTEALEQKPE